MPKKSNSKPKAKIEKAEVKSELEKVYDDFNKEEEAVEVELNEAPQSNDPADWEAFLAAEGLIDDDFDMIDEEI